MTSTSLTDYIFSMKATTYLLIVSLIASCGYVKEGVQELSTINCHMQSPVNIIPGSGVASSHQILVHYQTSKERVANLGHTVEVEYDSGSYVTYDGRSYQFKQFHFHTPSEHMVNSEHYAMEMHIVHTLEKEGQEEPEYLVIGVFFDEGENSEFLDSFLGVVPSEEGEVFESADTYVNAAEVVPESLQDFYNYRGSLTTPPYTETVNWVVLKEIRTASAKQIEQIKSIEGDNARRVQVLYNRVIEEVN